MEYTKEQLRKVQEVELQILLKFDSICKKYSIKYQLMSGTLLGAIRHGGFIPWDDDIDVCMLRKDYEQFLKLCNQDDLGLEYFLQTNKSDPTSVIQFAKLRRNNTIFEPENEVSSSAHKGIYIDIFPLDNVKPGTPEGEKQYKYFNIIYSIVTSTVKSRVRQSKTPWKRRLRFLFYIITRIVPKKYFDEVLFKICTQFDDEETKYVNHLTNGTAGNRMHRFLMEREKYLEMIEVQFEGYSFPAPKSYDEVLSRSYGDYMSLPPLEEQLSHHNIVRLKFED